MLGASPYPVQGMGALARRPADIAAHGLPEDHYDRYLRAIASLSRTDVQEAARRHLDPDRLAIVAVGPADRPRGQLEGLAPVTVRSADDPPPIHTPTSIHLPRPVPRPGHPGLPPAA